MDGNNQSNSANTSSLSWDDETLVPPTTEDIWSAGSVQSPSQRRLKQIWCVGGGKGGVGKSLIASSLALALTRQNQKVAAADFDLGCANLHTTLGVDLPRQTLGDFVTGRTTKLEECLAPTPIRNLDLISGAQDAINITNLTREDTVRIFTGLKSLDVDYIIADLGAGTNPYTLDFFLLSDIQIVTLVPEPTSIENAYRFIKAAYYRKLYNSKHLTEVKHLIEMAMDAKNTKGIKSPSDLFREVNAYSPEAGMRLKEEISKFKPKLIVNQARTQTDIDIGFSVKTVCKKYFGVEMDYIGYLDYDSDVWQAVRRKRPLMIEFPNSRFVSNIEKIVDVLVKKHGSMRAEL